jgi:uncharacterized OsmC-like protein
MSNQHAYHSKVRLARDYEFVAEFPDVPTTPAPLVFDEPAPLGSDRGPNAASVLGAAIGDCLAASLAFCLHKSRVNMDHLEADVVTHVGRNEDGKLRILGIDVELKPEVDAVDEGRLQRCEKLFEDFCIVTQSVRQGIPVNVTVAQREETLV